MAQWSHSRIESFRQCPRKYFYRYVARVKLPDEPESIAQFAGGRAHDALEWLYGQVRLGRVPPLEDVVTILRARWDAEWHPNVTNLGELSPPEHRALAERWVGDYHRRHAPFDDARTIELEKLIQFRLEPDGATTMKGFIDRLARTADGTWQIHDYKTNRRLPTQQDKDADPQLGYYEIGIRGMWKDVGKVELVWHFLAFDTSITSTRTPEQLVALRGSALETIRDAGSRGRKEAGYPTHETRLCAWCEYQSVCPVRKHLVKVAALPPNRFANEPGVALVDRWAGLDERSKELRVGIDALETEIDEVRDAIVALAEREDLEVVTGSEREAAVRHVEKVQFPRKTVETDEAGALEAQLRDSPWWAQASALDRHALETLWRRRATLDADLRALLEEFAQVEERTDVRLRKRRG